MKKLIISKLEKFGRAFLIPVSILPFAGIILGIGNGFTSDGIVNAIPLLQVPLISFIFGIFKVVGRAVFSNLPFIFAVGLAVGLSKKEKGTAALSATLGYFVFLYTMNYVLGTRGLLVDSNLEAAGQKMVMGVQVYDVNVFGGIIISILAYYATKHFMGIKLSPAFAFFEGPRFVPLIVMMYSIVAGAGAAVIWPGVAGLITKVSIFLTSLGAFGSFFYGMLERLLIPFGLHHALNSMMKFTELGGTATVGGTTYYGFVNIFAGTLSTAGDVFTREMTQFYAGQFIVKIFGLTGAAFAMYKTSYLQHRKKTASVLIAASIASVLTGITEPLEFTFLFIAPTLYLIHAFLAGTAFFVMYITGTVAFGIQGAGLINFILYNVLNSDRVSWMGTLWIGPLYFILYYFIFKFMILKFDYKTPGRSEEMTGLASKKEAREKYGIKTQSSSSTPDKGAIKSERAVRLIEVHGGKDNIVDVDACITRLRIDVKDKTIVKKDVITSELGAMGVTESGMQIQSIYGGEAKDYKVLIREELDMEI